MFNATRLVSSTVAHSSRLLLVTPCGSFARRQLPLPVHTLPLIMDHLSTFVVTRTFSSSLAEPDPTLFPNSDPPSIFQKHDIGGDIDTPLRADIRVMGSILGQVIQEHESPTIFAKVEELRGLAKLWREHGAKSDETFQRMADLCANLSNEELYKVSRAFTHFMAIANAAEGHHRARRIKESVQSAPVCSGALYPKPDSCGGAIPDLLKKGHSSDEIYKALCSQTTELVLTAHPTEVNRRTVLEKKRRIQSILTKADIYRTSEKASLFDKAQLNNALYREISSIWLTDSVSRVKPTPEKEAEKGTLVLETVIWEALPQWMRKLDATVEEFLGKRMPLDAAPVKFASWMGGDRDGNPNVMPNTTRQVCLTNRSTAARLFLKDLKRLESELSITTCSDEFRSHVGNAREPYRAFLTPILHRLTNTVLWAEQELAHLLDRKAPAPSIGLDEVYLSNKEFHSEIMLMHRSLTETGNDVTADGTLTDILRNVAAFGLSLVPLDVRQEADRHAEAIDAITRFLGLGSYLQWDEETKISWLTSQIAGKRPLLRKNVWHIYPDIFSPTVVDTLETFQMIVDQHEGSLGAYVISQATSASDVLAVLLLQLDAGGRKPLRVAPLFETLDDLKGAGDTMKKLFSLPVYMGVIHGRQEVMIGYSDSAKDAGRLAAVWAQYETQEKLSQIAKEHNVAMTFFHGKGGTIGRGGNPQLFLAIVAHTPHTINGQFRVTEQGEMIEKNLGFPERAERTMDIYTAAVLAEKLTPRPKPSTAWRDMMDTLSEISCAAYRKIVRDDERFVPYFRSVTPEGELTGLNIGSRPAKRKASGGVESLRAIPYIFSWAQVRYNVPVWLGASAALSHVLKSDKAPILREMYRDWDSFRTMIDMIEMVLAKSESSIAKHYEDKLVSDGIAKELGSELRSMMKQTEHDVLDLTEHASLGDNNSLLKRALQVRNPYVDCLNVLQVETLSRIRQFKEGQEDKVLKDALMTTIAGVANGMGNTG